LFGHKLQLHAVEGSDSSFYENFNFLPNEANTRKDTIVFKSKIFSDSHLIYGSCFSISIDGKSQ